MYPSPERFREVFDIVERRIEERWGVPVRLTDVPDPFTGDLDGAEIHIDWEESPESALFILVHLFGHTVQWNLSERARQLSVLLLRDTPEEEVDEAVFAEIYAFENEACAYSLQLLHECGVRDLDAWVSDFAACDYAYLEHFYRTREKLPFRSFWRPGMPLIAPRPLPHFEPQRWSTRTDGIVI